MKHADIVIVGAGIIGAAIAYELSRSFRARIVVVENHQHGQASTAAAGVLAVASGQARRGALLDLRRRSAHMFPSWVEALEERTGITLGYRTEGLLSVSSSEASIASLANLVAHRQRQGMRALLLDGSEVREIEPVVSPRVRGGALFPDDCSIDSQRFLRALVSASTAHGVEFKMGVTVGDFRAAGSGVSVEAGGERLQAGTLIVAAGCWSTALLEEVDVRVPIRPVQGEMLALRSALPIKHILSAEDTYLVPRAEELLIGSTTRHVGFDARVRAGGVHELLVRATTLAPGLMTAPILRWWSGLRPCATIHRPIISRLDAYPDVILATGHHRNGILLAPVTASLVRAMVMHTAPEVPLKPFGYRRR